MTKRSSKGKVLVSRNPGSTERMRQTVERLRQSGVKVLVYSLASKRKSSKEKP